MCTFKEKYIRNQKNSAPVPPAPIIISDVTLTYHNADPECCRLSKGRNASYFSIFTFSNHLKHHRRRWEYNIKVDIWKVGCEGTEWIDLAEKRVRWRAVVNAVIYLGVS